MYLTTRKIRSAGRSSGSIEITLPADLQILQGIECRLTIRDGVRPEIVLQPELSAAQSVFRSLWQLVRSGLSEIDDIDDFSPLDFNLTLFPANHWQERPPLAWADALAVLRDRQAGRDSSEVARLISFLTQVAGSRLGLTSQLALAFGDATAYLITHHTAGLGTDFERGMAHRAFWNGEHPSVTPSPLSPEVWVLARPGLRRVYQQFREWQDKPATYAGARENWYRALSVEVGMKA